MEPPGPQAIAGLGAKPIMTPILIAGADPRLLELLAPELGRAGWMALTGGSGAGDGLAEERPLAPGQSVGAQLMGGDLALTATGTVTEVSGDRVWAFGHPFLRTGPTWIPMTSVEIIATVPSDLNSYKLGNAGGVIGAFDQDQFSGIAGTLGESPELVPISVAVSSRGSAPREFHYEMIQHPAWSPFLGQVAALNSVLLDMSVGEEVTLGVATTVRIAGHPEVRYAETYTRVTAGGSPPVAAAIDIGRLLAAVVANRFENARLEAVDIRVDVEGRRSYAVLEEIQLLGRTVHPGDDVEIRAILTPFRGARQVHALRLHVPEDAPPGPLQVVVGSAAALEQLERAVTAVQLQQMDSLGAIVDWVNELRSSDRIYLKAYRPARGAVLGGRLLPDLPRSVLEVIDARGTGGAFAPLSVSTVVEESEPLDFVLLGGKVATLEVLPAGSRTSGDDAPGAKPDIQGVTRPPGSDQ